MGVGKTYTTLEFIKRRIAAGEIDKAIVVTMLWVVPHWLEDNAKFTPDLKMVGVIGTSKKKEEGFRQRAQVYVTNYDALTTLVTCSAR